MYHGNVGLHDGTTRQDATMSEGPEDGNGDFGAGIH